MDKHREEIDQINKENNIWGKKGIVSCGNIDEEKKSSNEELHLTLASMLFQAF